MDVGTNKKAFQINLDAKKYGTFAEIGAGQEVARRFFHVSFERIGRNPALGRKIATGVKFWAIVVENYGKADNYRRYSLS